ncbi:KAP family P-loop NTPase fold protein [Bathymodiolus thermophilus thioautotrophic gill symbiont]|uniref:KAP NTPase domain-containing protein n=1 Tax=Bathymodiolus thermophilus thioautotrophic gill symbiont TaxID=2360 RepID=A0A1J5TXL2_9GAMM|nr:P-loop NTPase fold protein [Bathymodiolus thermophilus thioautotrophic gill symbiont]OIR24956.1 hypothetical protein BGC33_05025 [Bathymodiolus thermophilus thioautotrophic gill symbiont]
MKIVTPPLVIEKSDAFKNDVLNRKAYGKALLNLVRQSSDELVISLDGKWGEGKSTFVKMWQGLLSEDKIPSIYIDAFANDYLDDAFIPVASAITVFVEENIEKDSAKKVTDLKNKAKRIGGKLLSLSTKVAIKAASLGVIKETELSELNDIKNDFSKGSSSLLENIIEEHLASHSKDITLIEEFRELLSEIPSKLKDTNQNPLVIIIDELDRCKPSFAIEMLEKIKHLFSVKNVVFILVMHKEQLEESVRCIYGKNIDAHAYLQKFINIETKLPKQKTDRYTNDLKSYSGKLFQLHELETWGDDQNIVYVLEPLTNHFDLSLRQLEKVFTNLSLLYGIREKDHFRVIPIIVFLAVIKVVKPQIFDKLLHQKISYSDVCHEINLSSNEEQKGLHWLMNLVRYALLSTEEFGELDSKDEIKNPNNSPIRRYDIKREELIPFFAQQLSMFIVR